MRLLWLCYSVTNYPNLVTYVLQSVARNLVWAQLDGSLLHMVSMEGLGGGI